MHLGTPRRRKLIGSKLGTTSIHFQAKIFPNINRKSRFKEIVKQYDDYGIMIGSSSVR